MTETKKKEQDRITEMREAIESRANHSLAILGKAFVRNGSGRFLNIRSDGMGLKRLSRLSLEVDQKGS